MTTPWKEHKNKIAKLKNQPWHLLNKNNYIDEKISDQRLGICEQCPELIKITSQCKKCGCFMNMKVKLKQAECPLRKW